MNKKVWENSTIFKRSFHLKPGLLQFCPNPATGPLWYCIPTLPTQVFVFRNALLIKKMNTHDNEFINVVVKVSAIMVGRTGILLSHKTEPHFAFFFFFLSFYAYR